MSDIIIDLNSSPKYNFMVDLQGESLYQKWLALGNTGTESDFIYWLQFTGDGTYEPVITDKKTAFNKDFGTTAGTVADGGAVQTSLSNKQSTSSKNQPNGYAGLDSSGKLYSNQLPSITISDTFVVGSEASMLAIAGETGDVAVRTDLSKSFILKGNDPTVLANWQELLTPASPVSSIFGRVGSVTANAGDYTADQITETTTRKFQTANQKLFNDATSSIQNQLNARLTGSMTSGRIPKATGATSLGDSLIYDNGTNIGIGTVPQGVSTFRTLEIGSRGIIYDNNDNFAFGNNAYNDGSWRYKQTGAAVLMSTDGGNFVFNTAPSGSQNAIFSFTERMRITLAGNLLIGTSTDNGQKLQLNGSMTATSLSLSGNYSTDLTTNSAWSSYQTIINPGTLLSGVTYMISIRWNFTYPTNNQPYYCYCSFLWVGTTTNSAGGIDNDFTPACSTHTGSGSTISFRSVTGTSTTSGIQARLNSFATLGGVMSVKAIRLE